MSMFSAESWTRQAIERSLRIELDYLGAFVLWVAAAFVLYHLCPDRHRKTVLLVSGIVFLAVFLDPRATLFMLAFSLVFHYATMGGGHGRGVRLWGGAALLIVVFVPVCLEGWIFDYYVNGMKVKSVVAAWALVVFSTKSVYVLHEIRIGRAERVSLEDYLIYMWGLPVGLGRSAIVPCSHFWERYRARPTAQLMKKGVTTIAIALLHLLAVPIIGLEMAAYRPDGNFALRLEEQSWLAVWLALNLFHLQIYLAKYGYEQFGIGIARLFGFDIKDNFANPLASNTYAAYWRRWNIYFRDMLVSMVYFPTLLALSRAMPKSKWLNLSLACIATFAANYVFLLFAHLLFAPPTSQSARYDVMWTLAIFDLCQALLVVFSLVVESRFPLRRGRFASWPAALLGIAITFHLRSALVLFFRVHGGFSAEDLFSILGVAFFIG